MIILKIILLYITTKLDSWNKIIFEFIQAQPIEFGIGFSSFRIWVNGTATSRVYCGDFATDGYTISDGSSLALDICGEYNDADPYDIQSSVLSYSDIANFIWFRGSESLYQNYSGISCSVIITPLIFVRLSVHRSFMSDVWFLESESIHLLYL